MSMTAFMAGKPSSHESAPEKRALKPSMARRAPSSDRTSVMTGNSANALANG
jgi:hypothetical protein